MQGENYSICIDTRYCCWLCTDRLDLLPPENAITILYCFSAALLMVVYDESSSSFLHMYWMINDASWMKPPGLLHLYGTSVLYSSNFFRTHAYTIKIYIFHPFSYCAGHEIKKLERERERNVSSADTNLSPSHYITSLFSICYFFEELMGFFSCRSTSTEYYRTGIHHPAVSFLSKF